MFLNFASTSNGATCSGVLITPAHVLTAAHCFNGSYNWPLATSDFGLFPGASVRIQFSHLPNTGSYYPQPGDVTSYTPSPGHQISVLTSVSPMNFDLPMMSTDDLAIVPLDKRVPGFVAVPAKLPFGPTLASLTACSSTFNGTYLGFGGGGLWADPGAGTRRSGSREVYRNGTTSSFFGDVYVGEFTLYSQFFDGLPVVGDVVNFFLGDGDNQTLQGGDSGGPLFQSGTLCGINSSLLPLVPSCSFNINPLDGPIGYTCDLTVQNHHTRVDTTGHAAWILDHIVDSRGHFVGTCGGEGEPAFQDVDSDGDFIPDACDPCPSVPDDGYRDTHVVQTEPDFDKDGILDFCDNCPDRKNPFEASGLVLWQPDVDHDGVGDACDSCPRSEARGVKDFACCNSHADCGNPYGNPIYSRCFPIDLGPDEPPPCPGFAGRCSLGVDSDRDLIADNCDNCREDDNHNQEDADDDGVGDVCDNCPGLACENCSEAGGPHPQDKNDIPALECTTDAECVSITGNPESICVPGKLVDPPGVVLPSHCSKMADPDQDGIGSACDSCALTANPVRYVGGVNGQPNCNLDTEIVRGEPYPYVGDACDPNPCTRTFEAFVDLVQTDHTWVSMSYNPQLLPPSYPGVFATGQASFDRTYTGTPAATVGGRFCDCIDALNPSNVLSALECNNRGLCSIDANQYGQSAADFYGVSLVPLPSAGATPPTAPTSADYAPGSELPALAMEAPWDVTPFAFENLAPIHEAPSFLAWDITADGAGLVPGFPLTFGKLGVYWAAVRDIPQMQPASVQSFTALSNHYQSAFFGKPTQNVFGGKAISQCKICDIEPCAVCKMLLDAKSLVIDPTNLVVSALNKDQLTDVTAGFSASAIQSFTLTNVRWLGVAEGGGWLRSGDVGFAALSSDGAVVREVLARRGPQIQSLLRRSGPVGAAAAPAATDPDTGGPAPRTDFGAVLSARESAIFVTGGRSTADGKLTRDLWRYDIGEDRWYPQLIVGPKPRRVLAATYRPEDRSILMIDTRKLGPIHQARLLRYDIRTDTMSVMGTWLRTGLMDRVDLSAGPDGELVISGSSSKLNRTFGVIVTFSGNSPKVIGGFVEQGVLGLEPTLTLRGLTLPLLSQPDGLHHVFLRNDQLFPAAHDHGKHHGKWGKGDKDKDKDKGKADDKGKGNGNSNGGGSSEPTVPGIGECL
ncbi:MAG: trypsin-like serine protease [Myxococcales bacterium]|nr:trypsin-like serine protease [Myxococcales bacterium]